MYYSKNLSLLFIASPKSGTKSVHKYLLKIDPDGERHSITLDNKKLTSQDMFYGVVGHARAWELKKALGDHYNKLNVFGFVRHPFDKLISSYFFNKSIKLTTAFKIKGKKKLFLRKLRAFLSFLAPKILPIDIWALLFPMKTSRDYFFDQHGNRIVQYLGRTDHLNEDLVVILKEIGITHNANIPHINKSKHKSRSHYFNNRWIKQYLNKKYSKDLELYRTVEKEMRELHQKML